MAKSAAMGVGVASIFPAAAVFPQLKKISINCYRLPIINSIKIEQKIILYIAQYFAEFVSNRSKFLSLPLN